MERATDIAPHGHELLERHLLGEGDAFAELVSMYRPGVQGYFARCGLDAATCEDLAQETFLRVEERAREGGVAGDDPSRPPSAEAVAEAHQVLQWLGRRVRNFPFPPFTVR